MTATTTSDLPTVARLRRGAAGLPARAARGRPGRRGAAGGDAGHPLDQDDRQGLGDRPGHPDGRPDHAGGRRHPRQGARAVRQGAAGPTRPTRPARSVARGLRLPGDGAGRRRGAGRLRRPPRQRGDRVPVRAGAAGGQAGRHPGRRRRRRRRDRHGDQPGRVPGRPLPGGLRGDRRGQGGVRRRPPQGDPGDRRAGHLRQRPARLLAGDAGRRRLHQDLHRQGPAGRDAAGHAGHAGGGPRLPRRRPAGRSASSRPAASAPPRTPSSTW